MALTLRIENETRLPDGGPVVFRLTGRRGADLGRDPYLDWTLPDPTRFISGKHCEIRWQDGGYVLYDVSTNGTFLNGNDRRMDGPHRLAHGDRLMIGNYIVVAEFDDEPGLRAPVADPRAAEGGDFWAGDDAAPPIDRSALVHRRDRPVKADFLDWAVEVPHVDAAPSFDGGAFAPPPPMTDRRAAEIFGLVPRETPAASAWDAPATPAAPPRNGAAAFDAPAGRDFDPDGVREGGPEAPAPGAVWVDSAPKGEWASPSATPPQDTRPDDRPNERPSERLGERRVEPAQNPPRQAAAHGPVEGGEALIAILAEAAGIPAEAVARRDPAELMVELGGMLRLVTENMMAQLAARSETKRVIRSSEHTVMGATDNNPLKFSPSVDDALRLMLGPPMRSYLGGRAALEEGFRDLANHQLRTFASMQRALKMLVEDIDPAAIDKAVDPDHGISSLIGSRKTRLWDQFVTRWQAKTMRNEDGMVGLFLSYFADCYDRLGAQTKQK